MADERIILTAAILVAFVGYLYYRHEHERALPPQAQEAPPGTALGIHKMLPKRPITQAHDKMYEFVPTRDNPHPRLLSGVQSPVHNPYGNPMPYSGGVEVRSRRQAYLPVKHESDLERMYKGTDEWSSGYFFHSVPDPTHMAREVYWPEDRHPDIVSQEAWLARRF